MHPSQKDMKWRAAGAKSADDIHSEQRSMFATVFFVTAVSWGFCLFTDNFSKIVSGTARVGHLMTLCTCVCVCVYGMCVNSWCLCGGNWGGDQMVEVKWHELFCLVLPTYYCFV